VSPVESADAEPVAVTVIGGYLGAGKTTLVNQILRSADERFAVLVNDFGDVNIDVDLIASTDGDTITLTNGCICCSLQDGFATALDQIKSLDPRPDRLIIEASGVSDPASVAAWAHSPGFRLDATIVMVDAETIRERSRDRYVGDTIVRHLGSADLLVLNKIDLIDDTERAAVGSWLGETVPDTTIIEATKARLDPAVLFGPAVAGDRSLPAASPREHAHDIEFDTWTIRRTEPIERSAVESFMESLDPSIVRVKGFVALTDTEHPALLQGVGRRWHLERKPPERQREGAPGETAVVLIGRPDATNESELDAVWR